MNQPARAWPRPRFQWASWTLTSTTLSPWRHIAACQCSLVRQRHGLIDHHPPALWLHLCTTQVSAADRSQWSDSICVAVMTDAICESNYAAGVRWNEVFTSQRYWRILHPLSSDPPKITLMRLVERTSTSLSLSWDVSPRPRVQPRPIRYELTYRKKVGLSCLFSCYVLSSFYVILHFALNKLKVASKIFNLNNT